MKFARMKPSMLESDWSTNEAKFNNPTPLLSQDIAFKALSILMSADLIPKI